MAETNSTLSMNCDESQELGNELAELSTLLWAVSELSIDAMVTGNPERFLVAIQHLASSGSRRLDVIAKIRGGPENGRFEHLFATPRPELSGALQGEMTPT